MAATRSREWWSQYLPIVAVTVAISAMHYLTPPPVVPWHTIFQRFYYLPIIVAAVQFGWRGGLATAVFAAVVCYLPHIFMWHVYPGYSTSQYGDIVVFHLVGAVTGIVADAERQKRHELQVRADQLRRAYEELQNASELLKRADRLSAVGKLSASLAEEIQNPLATIERSVDAVGHPASQEECRQLFKAIRGECRAVTRLLTNLHRFATPRPPKLRWVDVGKVIQSVMNQVRSSASARGILLRCECAAGLPDVECDAEQLEQVILTLALNSVQAMPQGGEIVMAAWRRGAEILIQVEDERGETASEQLEEMFEGLGVVQEDGPGLGLSVADQIVRQHHGFITVQRNDGRGATFLVFLPLQRGRVA